MELEFKGTKTEWLKSENSIGFVYALNHKEEMNIFSLNINNDSGVGYEEIEANAKLIAAAPDLLEALINLTNTCEKYFSKDFDLREAKKAIEKALK